VPSDFRGEDFEELPLGNDRNAVGRRSFGNRRKVEADALTPVLDVDA
jgi:hypothetical protein